jgi:hypothetical protein
MDIGKNFKSSNEILRKNKRIALPSIILSILSLIVVLAVLLMPGVREIAEYSEKAQFEYDMALKAPGADIQAVNADFEEAQKETTRMIMGLITLPNLLFFIAACIVFFILSFYSLCLTYLMTAHAVKNQKQPIGSELRTAWKYFWSYVFLHFFWCLILIVPVMYVVFIVMISTFINKGLGIAAIIIGILATLLYLIYVSIRLLYSAPIMFMEDKKTTESIRQSYFATAGSNWKDAGKIIGVMIVIMVVFFILNAIVGLIFPVSMFSKAGWVANIAMSIISAFVNALMYIFIFKSYAEFKATSKKA